MRRSLPPLLLVALLVACGRAPHSDLGPTAPPQSSGDGEVLVWYVRNDAVAPGDGSRDAPFVTLAQAEAASTPDDVIYLFAGDGSRRGQDDGIRLKPGQRLLGSGATFEELPAGAAPHLGNARGAAVTLARDNVVRGLVLAGASGAGIAGEEPGSLTLESVVIRDVAAEGVALISRGGLPVDVRVRDLQVVGSGLEGFELVVHGPAASALDLRDSRLREIAGNAVQLTYLGNGPARFELRHNPELSSGRATGVRVFIAGNDAARVDGRIVDNVIGSSDPATAGDGLAVVVEGDAHAAVALEGNEVSGFGSYGLDLSVRAGSGSLDATVNGNTVTAPAPLALAGFRLGAGNGTPGEHSALCVALEGNVSDAGDLPGYLATHRDGTRFALAGANGDVARAAELLAADGNHGALQAEAIAGFTGGSCRVPAP